MQKPESHIALEKHVIRTLLYYDIFDYPLTAPEVFQYLGTNSVTAHDVTQCLSGLVDQRVVFKLTDFYSVQEKPELAVRRSKGNAMANRFYPLAVSKAALISKFPFVRAVLASGSLSKGYMDESCDLDFFIITARRRLWICRTLLVLYKRLFLGNSHEHFCVNYFVDEDHLEIEEQNVFTATELATVIPLSGPVYYDHLIDANLAWLKQAFPNFRKRDTTATLTEKGGMGKALTEKLLTFFGAGAMESIWMKLTLRRWRRLYRAHYDDTDFRIAFKTTPYASKNHPRNFQRRVMETYNEKVMRFEQAGGGGRLS